MSYYHLKITYFVRFRWNMIKFSFFFVWSTKAKIVQPGLVIKHILFQKYKELIRRNQFCFGAQLQFLLYWFYRCILRVQFQCFFQFSEPNCVVYFWKIHVPTIQILYATTHHNYWNSSHILVNGNHIIQEQN